MLEQSLCTHGHKCIVAQYCISQNLNYADDVDPAMKVRRELSNTTYHKISWFGRDTQGSLNPAPGTTRGSPKIQTLHLNGPNQEYFL